MDLEVCLYGGLERFVPGASSGQGMVLDLPAGATVGHLLARLAIPPGEVFTVLQGGRRRDLSTPLAGGDRVALFPPMAGG